MSKGLLEYSYSWIQSKCSTHTHEYRASVYSYSIHYILGKGWGEFVDGLGVFANVDWDGGPEPHLFPFPHVRDWVGRVEAPLNEEPRLVRVVLLTVRRGQGLLKQRVTRER